MLLGGRFEIGERLGEGAFGVIYAARNTRTGRKAAIKMTRRGESGSASILVLRNEGKVHSALGDTAGIAHLKDCGETPWGGYYLAMDLLGPSVESACEMHGAFSDTESALIGLQLLSALRGVHSAGLVHRDLCPGNVLTSQTRKAGIPVVKIADFGLARAYRDGSAHLPRRFSGTPVGTPKFAGRAALRGGAPSRRDDIESAGFTVWFCNTAAAIWPTQRRTTRLLESLCSGKLSGEILHLIRGARALAHKDEPDYAALIGRLELFLRKTA
jgi:serine/threonine protein kinase